MTGKDVAIIGGSIIGLAAAFRAAHAGFQVTVYEPDSVGMGGVPVHSAAWVAGGMLSPYSEAWPGEEAAFHLGLESLGAWPELLGQLAGFDRAEPDDPWTGGSVRTATGCILLGVDDGDARDLEMALNWALETEGRSPMARGAGVDDDSPVRRITRRQMRELEPGLTGPVRAAYHMPGEGSVDNRRLLGALRRGCRALDVAFVEHRVERLSEVSAHDAIVVAAGEGASRLLGLPIRNVKGEVLRLFERPGCEPAPQQVVRAQVRGRPLYLVPREGGMVVGATQYEHGEDRQVTAAGVRDLLADAETVFPAIGEYELREATAGLRPMSQDNLPYLGPVPKSMLVDAGLPEAGAPYVLAACGHGRNGVALASVTAAATLAYLESGSAARVSASVAACTPERVAEGRSEDV